MRLVAYTRLSQVNDREEESHEAQRQLIDNWAARHGHGVVAHHRDTISGTAPLAERPGLLDVLDALRDGEAEGVIVSKLDRLSRDVVVQEMFLRHELWLRGWELFSTVESEADLRNDPDDPGRKMLRVILGAVSEYERDMTALRMARGRRRAVQQGRLIGPAPAFGWRKDPDDPGRAIPDPGTFPLVEEAVRQRREGATLRDVAAFLGERTGRRWHAAQVRRLCERYERYPQVQGS